MVRCLVVVIRIIIVVVVRMVVGVFTAVTETADAFDARATHVITLVRAGAVRGGSWSRAALGAGGPVLAVMTAVAVLARGGRVLVVHAVRRGLCSVLMVLGRWPAERVEQLSQGLAGFSAFILRIRVVFRGVPEGVQAGVDEALQQLVHHAAALGLALQDVVKVLTILGFHHEVREGHAVAFAQLNLAARHAFPERCAHGGLAEFVLHVKYGLKKHLVVLTKRSEFLNCDEAFASFEQIAQRSKSVTKRNESNWTCARVY